MVRQKNFSQVIRIDGRNCFVEALDTAFGIEKVQLNFVSYDEKTNKQTAIIPIYLDFSEWMVLEADVLSGRISKLAEVEKAKGAKFPQQIFLKQGGVSAKNLKARGQEREDGMSLSRQFKIIPGNKRPFMVQGEQGKGEENEQGLIVSRYGGKPDDRVMVPMGSDELKQLVLMVGSKIRAYMSAQYVYMAADNIKQQKDEHEKRVAQFRKNA